MGKRDKKVVDEDMMHKTDSAHHVNIFTSPELKDYDFRAYLKEIPEAAELDPVGKERLDYIWEKEIKK